MIRRLVQTLRFYASPLGWRVSRLWRSSPDALLACSIKAAHSMCGERERIDLLITTDRCFIRHRSSTFWLIKVLCLGELGTQASEAEVRTTGMLERLITHFTNDVIIHEKTINCPIHGASLDTLLREAGIFELGSIRQNIFDGTSSKIAARDRKRVTFISEYSGDTDQERLRNILLDLGHSQPEYGPDIPD